MDIKNKMGVTYSETTKEMYEKYCRENLLMENKTEEVATRYENERVYKNHCLLLWVFLWLILSIKTIDNLANRYRLITLTSQELLVIAGFMLVGFVIFKNGIILIKRCLFPVYSQIEREANFKMTVQVYLYPLMELQDNFRAGLVERVYINASRSVIGVDVNTPVGLKRKDYYLYGGIKSYMKNGSLDFSYIDAYIRETAKAVRKI